MTETQIFIKLDKAIDEFVLENKPIATFAINKKPKSDWLTYNWRQITWQENGLNYIIEFMPLFKKDDSIETWTVYTAVWYDKSNYRYYQSYTTATEREIMTIATNATEILKSSFSLIRVLPKEEIPRKTIIY